METQEVSQREGWIADAKNRWLPIVQGSEPRKGRRSYASARKEGTDEMALQCGEVRRRRKREAPDDVGEASVSEKGRNSVVVWDPWGGY